MHISDNKRYIVGNNGNPFFYMADIYLRKRRDQGFTVFMPCVMYYSIKLP